MIGERPDEPPAATAGGRASENRDRVLRTVRGANAAAAGDARKYFQIQRAQNRSLWRADTSPRVRP